MLGRLEAICSSETTVSTYKSKGYNPGSQHRRLRRKQNFISLRNTVCLSCLHNRNYFYCLRFNPVCFASAVLRLGAGSIRTLQDTETQPDRFNGTARRCHLHTRHRENPKSHILPSYRWTDTTRWMAAVVSLRVSCFCIRSDHHPWTAVPSTTGYCTPVSIV
jgi:hypothetical protein